MLKPRMIQVSYPLGHAVARNGNTKLGYSKGGYALNKNDMPLLEDGRNALKK